MLVGAVIGLPSRAARSAARAGVALPVAVGVAALAGAATALDPRVPRDHAAREPDRLRAGADDLRGRGRAVVVPRQRLRPRRRPRAVLVRRGSIVFGLDDAPVVGPILFDQNVLVYASWLLVVARRVSISARTRPGLERARGRRGARRGRRHGDLRHAVPVPPHARRRRARGCRRARASASPSRRSGSTGSPPGPAGSRSRSSSSLSGGPTSASSAPTSSAPSRRCR